MAGTRFSVWFRDDHVAVGASPTEVLEVISSWQHGEMRLASETKAQMAKRVLAERCRSECIGEVDPSKNDDAFLVDLSRIGAVVYLEWAAGLEQDEGLAKSGEMPWRNNHTLLSLRPREAA